MRFLKSHVTLGQGYVTTVGPYWTFWCPENAILSSFETLYTWVLGF